MNDDRWPSNQNTSATGGYLLPAEPAPLPGGLTFEQFLQGVFVGISGLPGNLVRPKWQSNPPPEPDFTVDWLSIGPTEVDSDTYAFNQVNSAGTNVFQRMENVPVQCSFYGPNAITYAKIVRDGFQVRQNREALQSAKMDFVEASKIVRAPDFINERWLSRWEMTVLFRAEILRTYPVLTLLSGQGTLYTLGSVERTIPINSGT